MCLQLHTLSMTSKVTSKAGEGEGLALQILMGYIFLYSLSLAMLARADGACSPPLM